MGEFFGGVSRSSQGGLRWLARGGVALVGVWLSWAGVAIAAEGVAPCPVLEPQRLYQPKSLQTETLELDDSLSEHDIPTGQGGFARDYRLELKAGDRVEIAVVSESFDPVLAFLATDGSTVAENDDGPDGSTNPLLYTKAPDTGMYTIRVQTFGRGAGGKFKLKLTLLRPVGR